MDILVKKKKWVKPSLWILVLMVSVGPFGDTEYVPSLTQIAADFKVSYSDALYTMTSYLFGYALSQLIYGPLSDRFGRKPIMMIGAFIFILGSLFCCLSQDITQLILARFVQAIGACAGAIISCAAVRDAYLERDRGKIYARINAAFAIAPALGPVVGGYVQTWFGWQANFIVLLILSIILCFCVFWFFPETNLKLNFSAIRPKHLLKNYLSLFLDPYYLAYLLILGLCVGIVYTCLIESPALIIIVLGLPAQWFTVIAVSVLLGFSAGSLICGYLSSFLRPNSIIFLGLCLIILTALTMGVMVYLGYLSLPSVLIPISIIFTGIALILPMATAMAMMPFEGITGSASAMLGFFQMGLASLSTAALGHFRDGSAMAMPVSFTLLGSLAMLSFLLLILCRPGKKRVII